MDTNDPADGPEGRVAGTGKHAADFKLGTRLDGHIQFEADAAEGDVVLGVEHLHHAEVAELGSDSGGVGRGIVCV